MPKDSREYIYIYLSSRYNLERKRVVVDNFNVLHKPCM